MKYQIIVRLDNEEFEIEIEAKNWEEVCNYVFGKIEIIDKNESN
jgi:hypothetical protein